MATKFEGYNIRRVLEGGYRVRGLWGRRIRGLRGGRVDIWLGR